MPNLTHRTALVTGAGRGIGRATAIALAQEGAQVAVTARSQNELDEVVSVIRDQGGNAAAIVSDLSQKSSPPQLVAQVKESLGPIDILVNNAGVGSSSNLKPIVDFDDDFWDLTMAVNLDAPYRLIRAVLPDMIEKKHGRIITIASIAGKIPSPHGAAYTASKHGVIGLMRTVALELAEFGITANCVCPGPVRTIMNDKRIEYDSERLGISLKELESTITPIGRRLEPEEIAPWVVYLASDQAAAVTGQAFNIDGGELMSG